MGKVLHFAAGGVVQPDHFATGGSVGRLVHFVPKGIDTVPAMLAEGEGVLNRTGMKGLGVDLLHALNRGQVIAAPPIPSTMRGAPQPVPVTPSTVRGAAVGISPRAEDTSPKVGPRQEDVHLHFHPRAFEGMVVDSKERVEQLAMEIAEELRRGGRTRTAWQAEVRRMIAKGA